MSTVTIDQIKQEVERVEKTVLSRGGYGKAIIEMNFAAGKVCSATASIQNSIKPIDK